MRTFDRYLFGEFLQSTLAVLVVLLMVSVGAVFADVLGDIANGKVPAGLMLSQMGLQLIRYLPILMPLGLMLGLMLAVGRLYRDAEMPVLAAVGTGPRQLLKPLLMLLLPMVVLIGLCSLWWGPWARGTAERMVADANRNLLVSGLEAGRFTELPGGGVVYVGAMSGDGKGLARVFVYRQSEDRMDVTTARTGALSVEGPNERYLQLDDGFRVEGPLDGGRDFRLMNYQRNDVRMPAASTEVDDQDPRTLPLPALLADERLGARAELHSRLAPPLLALAFALMAVPLARSPPRQARYGRMVVGFLVFLVGTDLMLLGSGWLGDGRIPIALGMWWLVLPLLAAGLWMYANDGRVRAPRRLLRGRARG